MSIDAPIISANKLPLGIEVGGPDMRSTVQGWCKPMNLYIVTLTPGEGGDAVKSSRSVRTDGCLIQSKARDLDIKEDGDGTRGWRYWALYALTDPAMKIGDQVEFGGTPYRVMASWNRSQNGFFKYALREKAA